MGCFGKVGKKPPGPRDATLSGYRSSSKTFREKIVRRLLAKMLRLCATDSGPVQFHALAVKRPYPGE